MIFPICMNISIWIVRVTKHPVMPSVRALNNTQKNLTGFKRYFSDDFSHSSTRGFRQDPMVIEYPIRVHTAYRHLSINEQPSLGYCRQTNNMIGRTSPDSYILTPEQIDTFHKDGCVMLPNVLTEEEVAEIEKVFDRFLNREIHVPGKDFCDMSKPFGKHTC